MSRTVQISDFFISVGKNKLLNYLKKIILGKLSTHQHGEDNNSMSIYTPTGLNYYNPQGTLSKKVPEICVFSLFEAVFILFQNKICTQPNLELRFCLPLKRELSI